MPRVSVQDILVMSFLFLFLHVRAAATTGFVRWDTRESRYPSIDRQEH